MYLELETLSNDIWYNLRKFVMPVTFLGVGIVCFVKRRDIPASAAKPVSLKYF